MRKCVTDRSFGEEMEIMRQIDKVEAKEREANNNKIKASDEHRQQEREKLFHKWSMLNLNC